MARHLVIQLARFGDLLQSGRLIRSLERAGECHLCVDRTLVPLACLLHPDCVVHGVAAHADARPLDAGLFAELLAINRQTFAELSAIRPDAVYNLNHAGMNLALATLFPSEILHGYGVRHGQPFRERWIRLAFRWMAGQRRSAPLHLTDLWGLLAPDPLPPGEVNPPATPARPGGRGLGVVLAGQESRRSLPPPLLAHLIGALFERLNGPSVFLLGTRSERPAGHELLRHLPRQVLGKVVNLSGRTDWKALYESLIGLDALLSPDTGVMHLAARLGVPVYGFFLSSAWAWETGPYGLGHEVWQAQTPCAPCLESAPCPHDLACLSPLGSTDLLRALARGEDRQVEGLRHLRTSFDDLGLIWQDSTGESSPSMQHRDAMRQLIAEYARSHGKIPLASQAETPSPRRQACADILYHEADWMLPDIRS